MRHSCLMAIGALSLLAGCVPYSIGSRIEQLTPSRWSVSASASSPRAAANKAILRGAERARQAGFGYIQLVSLDGNNIDYTTVTTYGFGMTSEIRTVFIQIVGVNAADAPIQCEASLKGTPWCRALDVSKVIADPNHAFVIRD